MASDAVDHALGEALSHAHPCVTQELPLVGAAGYHALARRAGRIAGERGWTLERVTHLLDRYGDETPALLASIDAETGVFLRTEKSVLFIIPWPEYWVIGTTDTPWDLDVSKPVATAADVDYILEHANSVLSRPITRDDIIGVYAGLRPLLQPKLKPGA